MGKITDHDSYIAQAPDALRPLLIQVREQLRLALPDAEELIAYNMPGFGHGKSIIAGYAAFSKQCGLYVSNAAVSTHEAALKEAGFKPTKTGVTFSPKKPLSDALIQALALSSKEDLGH